MGLFSRFHRSSSDDWGQRQWASSALDGEAVFIIEDVFVITGRGPVFTGSMQSGSFSPGDEVSLDIPHGSPTPAPSLSSAQLLGTISAIESRHRRTQVIRTGETAGLIIAGLNVDELPYTRSGSGFTLDTKALQGCAIRKKG